MSAMGWIGLIVGEVIVGLGLLSWSFETDYRLDKEYKRTGRRDPRYEQSGLRFLILMGAVLVFVGPLVTGARWSSDEAEKTEKEVLQRIQQLMGVSENPQSLATFDEVPDGTYSVVINHRTSTLSRTSQIVLLKSEEGKYYFLTDKIRGLLSQGEPRMGAWQEGKKVKITALKPLKEVTVTSE